MAAPEEIGLGVSSAPIENCDADKLWKAMLVKIKQPNLFIPVVNVKITDCEGFVKRSMEFAGDGPVAGTVVEENIYTDVKSGEIRSVRLDKDGKETDMEIINVLHKDPVRIEYFQRSRSTKERVPFKAPKAGGLATIAKTIEMASS